ncbi:MAG: carboxypeptidase-like regulatory domain-containing protein [Calditrichaeota bacterium]|nr:carboxypeptidase-like regulatory domain-containing protein [Calditrichota bacterium]
MKKWLFLLLIMNVFAIAQQGLIKGTVIDEKSGEPLSAANLQISGTYHGTITNEYGEFILENENYPVTLEISFIGYAKKRLTLKKLPDKPISILLKPVILETEAIVVTAENPAVAIMRKVIENKLKWRDSLQTYKVDAYARVVLANDSAIISISESVSDAYWDKERGPREVIKSKRQTENLKQNQNFAFSSFTANFYDDDIDIMGYKVVGPTNPDAFDYYDFKLVDRKGFDGDTVFVIQLIPTAKLNPTFTGTVSVLDKVFALLAVDVTPNAENIFMPMPIDEWNVAYKQQYSNFGKSFWLPVDMRASGDIKISLPGLEFPRIKYSRSVRLTDYQVNVPLPDSLYKKERVINEDSLAIAEDSLFNRRLTIIPLTKEEEVAYLDIDSTDTFEKAFKPTGFLAGFVETESDEKSSEVTIGGQIFDGVSPVLGYNRIEQGRLGINYERPVVDNFILRGSAVYKTAPHNWDWSYGISFKPGKFIPGRFSVDFMQQTATTYGSINYPDLLISFGTLFGAKDYNDYYSKKALNIGYDVRFKTLNSKLKTTLHLEKHQSLNTKVHNYNLFGYDLTQRANPMIDTGEMRTLEVNLQWGGDYVPFGVVGQQRAELNVEYSNPDFLNSDFDFTQCKFNIGWNFRTFLQRRMLPNTFDIQLAAGLSTGEIPLQKMGSLDANYNGFSPFGVFRTLRDLPYIGEDYLGIFWEHNFRSVPFELIGLRWFAEKNIGLIVFGGHGRTWLSDDNAQKLNYKYRYNNNFHNELGVSVNGLLKFFRVDVGWRLDNPATYVGVSMLRWF